MLMVQLPLDVVHIDKRNHVVKILHSIRPWRLGPFVPKSSWVIELPAGTALRTMTQVGDVVAVILSLPAISGVKSSEIHGVQCVAGLLAWRSWAIQSATWYNEKVNI